MKEEQNKEIPYIQFLSVLITRADVPAARKNEIADFMKARGFAVKRECKVCKQGKELLGFVGNRSVCRMCWQELSEESRSFYS